MRDDGDKMSARRKGKFVEAALADCPFVERVPGTLHFTRVHCIPATLLVKLVSGRAWATHELVVVDVEVAARVGDEEAGGRFRKPFNTRHTTFINMSLKKMKFTSIRNTGMTGKPKSLNGYDIFLKLGEIRSFRIKVASFKL